MFVSKKNAIFAEKKYKYKVMELENKALLEVLDEYMDKKPSMVVENTVENFGS